MCKKFLPHTIKAALFYLAFGAVLPASAGQPAGIQSCADCHGAKGASTEADVPVIAGQSSAYLQATMTDYREGKRPCLESKYRAGDKSRAPTNMCKIAAAMNETEIQLSSDHFSALPFVPAKQHFDAAKAAAGKKIHAMQCEKCHSEGGSSKEDDSGILAGQWMPYLGQSFEEFSDGSRSQPKKMKSKFDDLSAAEKDALIHYYGSLQ